MPCLALSIVRIGSRVKWSNPGKVANFSYYNNLKQQLRVPGEWSSALPYTFV